MKISIAFRILSYSFCKSINDKSQIIEEIIIGNPIDSTNNQTEGDRSNEFLFDKSPTEFYLGRISKNYSEGSEKNGEDQNLKVYIEDLNENTFMRVESGDMIDITASPADNDHRFNLIFKSSGSDDAQLASEQFNIFSYDNVIYVKNMSEATATIHVFDVMGREIASGEQNAGSSAEIPINSKTGTYIVKVVSGNHVQTEKVFIK